MGALSSLPNISTMNEMKLVQAGIETPEQLAAIGSREAIRMVRETSDPGACLSMLYGLEGAVRGIRWHDLPDEVKKDLKEFHKTL
jgi:DNA transformation protein